MYVYIAAPLTKGNRTMNVRRAIDAGDKIASRGHAVFIPHLYEFWDLIHIHEYEFWMKQDFAWLKKAEIVVRLHGPSEGADREVGIARQMLKIVFGEFNIDGLNEFMNSKYWCQTNLD